MTHTWMKLCDGEYAVGTWVRAATKDKFERVARVNTLRSAIRLVNLLNGGTGRVDEPLARFEVKDGDDGIEMHDRPLQGAAVVQGPRG